VCVCESSYREYNIEGDRAAQPVAVARIPSKRLTFPRRLRVSFTPHRASSRGYSRLD